MSVSRAERRAAVTAVSLFLPFAVLTVCVAAGFGPLLSFDASVVRSWNGAVQDNGWHDVFRVIAVLSNPTVILAAAALLAGAFVLQHQVRLAAWVLVIAVTQRAAYALLKLAIHRDRPDIPAQIGGWSYPSGHATSIAAGMGILVVLTWQRASRPGRRNALVTLWLAIALLVGLDRIFLAAHNPSDVVGGWLLGAVIVFGTSAMFGVVGQSLGTSGRRLPARDSQEHRVLGIVLNPIKIPDAESFKARVGSAARQWGWDEPLWFETTVDDAGGSMARAAVAAGADVVAVAGGDGTVRVVCSEMAGT
ncbi:MAG: hypothetical protein QOC80_2212, partial [Frankiaceae bacterium]|nr:hypothetical protein [Frankiaceae bacterium]